jgi:hypothetical protein
MKISYCLGLAVTVAVCAGPKPVGYLARLGPAPLRFQPPPKGLSEIGPLPPLAMTDPDPPIEFVGPPPPAEPAPVVETTTAPAQPAPGPVVQVEPVFTPQMFLQFFNDKNGTNRDFNLVVPYQFMPPPATTIPAPPSRAIYNLK